MIGGAALAPATGGTLLTATYAAGTYLAADGAYSAIEGHSFITGTQLTNEERIWAGIDSVVTIASMGSAAYLTKLAKSGAEGSTLLKNLATAGTHADDVNDVSKVIYSFATGQDPNAALQNLVLGQVMGLGMNSAGNYIGKKFGAPTVDLPGAKASHLDVPLQGKQIPNLDPDSVRFNSRQDLHLKASTADGTLAKLKTHPGVSLDVPKVKEVSGDNVSKAVSGVKTGDLDITRVDSQKLSNTTEPSRLEYLHSKYGKISSEELHKRINTPKLKRFVKNYDPVEIAKSSQGDFPYTGVDEYQNILLKKGDILFAGEPFPTGYMVSEKTITDVGNNATKLFEGVQVKPYYVRGMDSAEYRKIMGAYKFNEDINLATGITLSNPQFGPGGLTQYFVPDFQEAVHNKFIVPIKKSNIQLNNYKVNLSKYAEIEQMLHNLK